MKRIEIDRMQQWNAKWIIHEIFSFPKPTLSLSISALSFSYNKIFFFLIFKLLELFAARLQSDFAKIPSPSRTIYAQLQMPWVFPSNSIVLLPISIVAWKIKIIFFHVYWWEFKHFFIATTNQCLKKTHLFNRIQLKL